MGSAMATYCGQNYGAGKYGRIREGIKGENTWGWELSGLLWSLLWSHTTYRLQSDSVSLQVLKVLRSYTGGESTWNMICLSLFYV